MKLVTDVHYFGEKRAAAAGLLFEDWTSPTPAAQVTNLMDQVADYRPGRFFERELPCLMGLLGTLEQMPDLIIVDGHAVLDDQGTPGLGTHLYHALGSTTPVIGVAKAAFATAPPEAAVLRGGSQRALFVTACGVDPATARGWISSMHGPHRLPTLISAVDRLARDRAKNASC
ncbi:MAG: endonuclease V [Paracoccaceae bacterium]